MNQCRAITEANNSCKRQMPRLTGTVLLWITAVLTMAMTAHAQELTSFSDSIGKHVVYVANDYHVHQLRCGGACFISNSWVNEDLTQLAGGPSFLGPLSGPLYSSKLVSFSDAAGEHVFYRDPNTHHLNQLLFAGGVWSNHDLGVSLVTETRVSGYTSGGVEALFYTTGDQHVHALMSQNGLPWSDSDLTLQTGGALASSNFNVTTSFHDALGEHVFYPGNNGHLYQFYGRWYRQIICVGFPQPRCTVQWVLSWTNQDLGGAPVYYGRLTSFSDATGEHVFYFYNAYYYGLKIYDHYLPSGGSSWVDNYWGTAYGSNPFGMGITSFGSSAFGEQLFYMGESDLHVYAHSGTNGVLSQTQDLTAGTNAPPVSASCAELITSFTDSSAGWAGEDVFYAANDGDLHYLSKVLLAGVYVWLDNNLTKGSFPPTVGGQMHCR